MNPLFIGDETTAAGYRLAGCDVDVVAPEQPLQARARFAAALARRPPLVLVTAACAAALAPEALDAALAAFAPPVLVVPDASGRDDGPDLPARMRATLGIAA